MQSTNRKDVMVFILLNAYKFLLDFSYVVFISKTYAFYTFRSNFSTIWYMLSWVFSIFFSFWLVRIESKNPYSFSSYLLFMYYIVYFVPFSAMLYGGYDTYFIVYSLVFCIFFFLYADIFSNFNKRKYIFPLVRSKVNKRRMIYAFAIISFFAVLYMAKRTGFRLSFNMDNAYVYRVEAANISASALFSYLYSWSRVIVPLLICYFIVEKKYYVVIILLFSRLLSFGFDGMRLDVLSTFVAVILPFLFRKEKIRNNIYAFIPMGLIFLLLLAFVENSFRGAGDIDRVITFRVLFLPNLICSWFLDFFQTNVPDYFRQSFLRYFGYNSPYSKMGLDYLIGKIYLNDPGRANNGLVSDSMTNLGTVGCFVWPLVVNIWIYVVDRVTKHVDVTILLFLAIYFAYCFTNNFFTIILFTNGGFIVLFLLYFIDKRKEKSLLLAR